MLIVSRGIFLFTLQKWCALQLYVGIRRQILMVYKVKIEKEKVYNSTIDIF